MMKLIKMSRETRNQTPDSAMAKAVALFCLSFCSSYSALLAQTNTENSPSIQFNFVVPGASSLALGGAFLARADDATAAYSNPAGLTTLSKPEVSVEGRSWDFNHVFTDGGRIHDAEPTGMGIDTVSGLRIGEAGDRVEGFSFFSYVHPISKRCRLALYRHELANFAAMFETQGNFLVGTSRNRPTRTTADLYIVNYGVSAAVVAVGDAYEPKLSLGISLSYYDFSMDFITRRYETRFIEFATAADPGGTYGPPLYSEDNRVSNQIQKGVDTDLGINIGFLSKISRRWSFGGVYRQGPDFDLKARQEKGPQARVGLQYPTDELAKLHVPDVYGLGLAFTPTSSLKLSFDYDRVKYSRITDDIVDIFSLSQLTTIEGMSFGLDPELERFKVDDSDEFHVGVEYLFFWGEDSRSPLSLRLGAWMDPDHRIRFEGECANRDFEQEGFPDPALQRAQCDRFESLFRPGGDEIHYSAGVGIAELPIGDRTKFQIDLALDHSKRINTAAIAAVFRFGQ